MGSKKKMSKQKKSKWFLIIFSLLIVFVVGITVFMVFFSDKKNETLTDDGYSNTNKKFVEDKDVDGILFTNIKCSYDGNNSLITYTIVNHTKEVVNIVDYDVMIRDKNGNILAVISPNLDYDLKPEESYDTGNAIDIDVSNAYSMELLLDEDE